MTSKTKTYIDSLVSTGAISFTTSQMVDEMDITKKAAERALERLRHNREIATPAKGYYLIIPPEFRQLGCLPPNYFIDDLMSHWKKEYYVGLLSASMFYGAAHQQPQMCQIIVSMKRPNVVCGQVTMEFIQNTACEKTPIQLLKTPTGTMKVSTPEATAMDMMKFIKQSGGLNRIVTVLDELAESMTKEKLDDLTKIFKETTWMQRLGHLLDKLGYNDLSQPLYEYLSTLKTRIVPLVPYSSTAGRKKDKKWRITINADVESDLDDTY